jgi:hypothetical protein
MTLVFMRTEMAKIARGVFLPAGAAARFRQARPLGRIGAGRPDPQPPFGTTRFTRTLVPAKAR